MFNKDLFKAQMLIAKVSIEDIAQALGINVTTVYRKLADNGRFDRDEIAILVKVLKIDTLELMNRIFFATELTEK